jgi:CelD/BcsL family acetyltransferase involved in cellulose biosynthesis
MITVHEVNDSAGLAGLAPWWHELLCETPGASFFHTPDWLETYWAHFGAGQRLRVLMVSSQDRPHGILPLVVRNRRRRIGSPRVLSHPLDDWGSFYGPIGPDPTTTLLAGVAHVRRTKRDWDLIELAWTDASGSDAGRTRMAMTAAGLKVSAERWQPCALVELTAFNSWDAYWATRTSRWRNNVRRSEKKLATRGEISYVRYRPGATACGETDRGWKLYDACEKIAGSSWQGASRTGTTLTHDAVRPFLRDCHQAAAKAGALDLNLLLIDDQPIAFNYAYHFRGYVFGLRTGYDPVQAPKGAGTVLQARMIEDCFARGDHTYDLGPSYLDCKRYWQTRTRYSYRYTHFASHVPLAQLIRAKRSVQRLLGTESSP